MQDNIISVSICALFDALSCLKSALPILYDKYGNLIYKIIEGKEYGSVIESDDVIVTDNIKMYEYIAIEPVFELKREMDHVVYRYVEGEKEGVSAVIGFDMDNNVKAIDMLEGHIIAGGASRWGKSSFLNIFVTNIMRTYTENEVMFIGCDYKKADIYYFRRYKHFRGMSTNKVEFMAQIKALEKEMSIRADILDKANCRNFISYNKKNDKKLSCIIFVIDELMQVVSDKECKEVLHTVMSKCASYGIYFVLASQDLTKETIGRCKMNCSQVIGFHTFDQTDSDTLIGKGYDLQDINVKGRCKVKNSVGVIETQVMYIDEDTIESVLKPFEKKIE